MMRLAALILLVVVILFAAFVVFHRPSDPLTPLRKAESLELYSLEPTERVEVDSETGFHGWKVLGSLKTDDAATRKKLIDALEDGIQENENKEVVLTLACFEPRHGIRVVVEGRRYDYVICFHCLHAHWYTDDDQNRGFLTTGSPQEVFDGVLSDASIELASPSPE